MKPLFPLAAIGLALTANVAPAAPPTAMVGQPAPAFSASDTSGRKVSLADFAGKTVVLEWVNPGCPYVQKHYHSANLPGTQREATAQGVVWLARSSSSLRANLLLHDGHLS